MGQAVRDMEQAQMLEGARLKRQEHEAARLEKLSTELEQRLEQDQAALDDCLSAGQDNLARAVLRRRLEAERTIARIGRQLQDNQRACAQSRSRLAEQDSRLMDLRARVALFDAEAEGADRLDADPATAKYSGTVRDADIEIALLQAKRQREAAA